MTGVRITERLMVSRSLTSLQSGLGRLAVTQEQLSSGRVINRPSDSPSGTNDAMRLRAQLAAQTQYKSNAEDGGSWLDHTDATLGSMVKQVDRARELMLSGASTGNNNAASREALATELAQIRDGLIDEANTQHLGRPLFGGTTAGEAAYDEDGTFIGDDNPVLRTIGDGVDIAINVSGGTAFTSAGGQDLFTVLNNAIDALRNDPSALTGGIADLDAVLVSMKSAQAEIGARTNRVESTLDALASADLNTKGALSTIENVDIASATMDLQMQEVAYQASLAATARVIQPSLVDFLR